jgi:hypothetical protein
LAILSLEVKSFFLSGGLAGGKKERPSKKMENKVYIDKKTPMGLLTRAFNRLFGRMKVSVGDIVADPPKALAPARPAPLSILSPKKKKKKKSRSQRKHNDAKEVKQTMLISSMKRDRYYHPSKRRRERRLSAIIEDGKKKEICP